MQVDGSSALGFDIFEEYDSVVEAEKVEKNAKVKKVRIKAREGGNKVGVETKPVTEADAEAEGSIPVFTPAQTNKIVKVFLIVVLVMVIFSIIGLCMYSLFESDTLADANISSVKRMSVINNKTGATRVVLSEESDVEEGHYRFVIKGSDGTEYTILVD